MTLKDKKISRRKFLTACAGAVVLASGGLALADKNIWRSLTGQAEVMSADEIADVKFVRQIITKDNTVARTIMWQTDEPMEKPLVEYRQQGRAIESMAPSADTFMDDGVSVIIYTASLTELPAGKTLEYRITAGENKGPWHSLRLDDGNDFSALIFPDSQSNDYSDWQNLVQGAYKRNANASFFINMGDLVDNGEDHKQWQDWLAAVGGIIDRIPVAPIMGNHETYNQKWKVREPVAYLHEFIVPDNGSADFSKYYYSFDYGAVHFIVLNTQEDEVAEFKPDSNLLSEQQAWFRQDVQHSDKKWKVVLMHRDPLQYRIHNRPERMEGIDEIGKKWMPLFDELRIDVVFSAHLHTYRNRGHLKNFVPDAQGPLYILTGVAGNVRYPNLWIDHALDKKIAPQPETDNYIVFSATSEKLNISCYLPDGTEIDHEIVSR